MKKILILSLIISLLAPGVAFASIDTNLKYGMRNTEVSELQEYLIDKGFLTGAATNFFGPLTLKAVKAFQASVLLPTTGFVGEQTRSKINAVVVEKPILPNVEPRNLPCINGGVFNVVTGKRCNEVIDEAEKQRQIQIQLGIENDRRIFELAEQKKIRDAEALQSARVNAENAKILEIRAVENQIFERKKKYVEDRQTLSTQPMSSGQYNAEFTALQSRYQLDLDLLELKLAGLRR